VTNPAVAEQVAEPLPVKEAEVSEEGSFLSAYLESRGGNKEAPVGAVVIDNGAERVDCVLWYVVFPALALDKKHEVWLLFGIYSEISTSTLPLAVLMVLGDSALMPHSRRIAAVLSWSWRHSEGEGSISIEDAFKFRLPNSRRFSRARSQQGALHSPKRRTGK